MDDPSSSSWKIYFCANAKIVNPINLIENYRGLMAMRQSTLLYLCHFELCV